jgi:hypothetical protein
MKTSDHDLMEKYLDGTATPEEFAVLEGRLRSSPEARLELLQESGFECQLRVLLKTAPIVYAESADTEMVDVAEDALPRPGKTIHWRPAWLWIPAVAAAAALLVALALPLLPSRRQIQIAGTGVAGPKRAPVAVVCATQQEEETTRESAEMAVSFGIAALPSPPADGAASAPGGTAVAVQGPGLDHRVAERMRDDSPENPSAVVQVAAPRFPAAPNPAGARAGNIVALARPAGAGPDGNRAGVAILPASASMSSAVVAVVAAVRRKSDGNFTSASGKILLIQAMGSSKDRHAVQAGDKFLAGDAIETGPSSGGTLRYADGATVRLYSDTHLALSQTDHNRTLSLASGAVDLQVPSQGAGGNFTVRTSYVEARGGAGTAFRVLADGSGSWVGVKAGRVEVARFRDNGEVVLLEPGYCASAARGGAPASMLDPNWRNKCQALTGSPRYQ